MAVATVALFSCPDLSTTGKIVWTAVFYFLYSMLATALQIPYGAIINAVTDREGNYDLMIRLELEDSSVLPVYLSHPLHQEFARSNGTQLLSRASFDYPI